MPPTTPVPLRTTPGPALAGPTTGPASAGRNDFGSTLRQAIRARGLTLDRLQARLLQRGIRVSLASMSNWQRGTCRPERSQSLRAIYALEEILDLPRTSLVALLGPPRPRGRWAGPITPNVLTWEDVCPARESLDELLSQLKNTSDGQLGWLSAHEQFRVGPRREESSVHTRAIFEARASGVDRHVAVHYNERSMVPDVRRTAYCRPGRVRTDEKSGLTAAELLFDRPLDRGETYVVEYEFAYSTGGPLSTYYGRWFRFPAHEYLLQVQFDPTALPTRCYHTWRERASSAVEDVGELRLSGWHTVHLALLDVRPGVHGIRWEWD